jgi:hypothetical protein
LGILLVISHLSNIANHFAKTLRSEKSEKLGVAVLSLLNNVFLVQNLLEGGVVAVQKLLEGLGGMELSESAEEVNTKAERH